MKKVVLKNYFIAITLLLLLGITFGYALLNSTLNIIGKSNISKNTWDVHFDNVVVKDGSVEAVKTPIIENDTKVDFEVQLNLPGDYYEFTVDVVNNGTIDAMIDSIEKLPELTLEQQKYLNYIIEYENGEQISTKQLVSKESFVRLKVRVEIKKDIIATDLPEVGDVLYLSFTLNYVQADNNGVSVKDDGIDKFYIGNILSIGTEQFYVIGTEENNVKLLAKYNLYVGQGYDSVTKKYINYGDAATGMQDENMLAFDYNLTKWDGMLPYNKVKSSIENYKNLLESKFNIVVVEARTISYEEITNPETFSCSYENFCSNKYPWIYSTTYWLEHSYSSTHAWGITANRDFKYWVKDLECDFGVRPVIVVSKSYFE